MRSFVDRLVLWLRERVGRGEDLPPLPGSREIEQAAFDRMDASPEERALAEAAARAALEKLRREEGGDRPLT